MNIQISQFTIESYDDVIALWKQCEGIGLSGSDSLESIQAYLDRNPGMSFIARANGQVVGAALAGHDGRRGYIHHLAVHPEHRHQGIGRMLADHCMVLLAKAGIQKCHLFIYNTNGDGIAFWKAIGWTPREDIGLISKFTEAGSGD